MTRARIAQLLELVVLEMANKLAPPVDPQAPRPSLEPGAIPYDRSVSEYEWAYVKGLASGAVLQFRDRLKGAS